MASQTPVRVVEKGLTGHTLWAQTTSCYVGDQSTLDNPIEWVTRETSSIWFYTEGEAAQFADNHAELKLDRSSLTV